MNEYVRLALPMLCYLHSSVLQAVGWPGAGDTGAPSRSSCRCVGLRREGHGGAGAV